MVYRWPGVGLFPPSCILCGLRSGGGLLCPGCSADLPRLEPGCPTCAGPSGGGRPCGHCQHRPPPFDRTWAAFAYRDDVATLIRGLKYHRRLNWANALGALLAGEVRARGLALPDRLVAVPLHHERLRERGFNQAREIARTTGRLLGLPVWQRGLKRMRATQPQTTLDPVMRRRNVRGAFQCRGRAPAPHLAIVDDVMTTGSTVGELARVLRGAGADRIDVWVVARARS